MRSALGWLYVLQETESSALEEADSSAGAALESQEELAMSFLASRHEQGIKRVGLIYSPRKSWWAGMIFVVLSIVIFIITIVTAFVH